MNHFLPSGQTLVERPSTLTRCISLSSSTIHFLSDSKRDRTLETRARSFLISFEMVLLDFDSNRQTKNKNQIKINCFQKQKKKQRIVIFFRLNILYVTLIKCDVIKIISLCRHCFYESFFQRASMSSFRSIVILYLCFIQ